LRSAFDAICHGISVLDSDLNILLVNQTVEKWYSHALPAWALKISDPLMPTISDPVYAHG